MQAAVLEQPGRVRVATVPIPVPGRGQVLVKVEGAAQNPVDAFFITVVAQPGTVVGCDFVGIVVQIGSDVPHGLRRVGERVAGFVYGGVTRDAGGAFAEYVLADAAVTISIPNSLSVEEAAGLGIAPFTACQVLHQSLRLPLQNALSKNGPISAQPPYLLVWSGASAVGQYTIQLASLLGLHVIATASPARHDLLRRLGARAVVDYADSDAVTRIRNLTCGRLNMAVDCFGAPEKVAACLGPQGGTVALIRPNKNGPSRSDVDERMSLVFTLLGKAVQVPVAIPALPPHHADGEQYGRLLGFLLAQRKLKLVPPRVFPGGFRAVQEGLNYAASGRVHAEKVTYVF
ncbi:dehydrogenase [Auricularia subglabra TFB-10046 SS5]|nr:dehydrogenase [Auricularia subglabra TFB-10046 SS5]